jgi:hypothetical protein
MNEAPRLIFLFTYCAKILGCNPDIAFALVESLPPEYLYAQERNDLFHKLRGLKISKHSALNLQIGRFNEMNLMDDAVVIAAPTGPENRSLFARYPLVWPFLPSRHYVKQKSAYKVRTLGSDLLIKCSLP